MIDYLSWVGALIVFLFGYSAGMGNERQKWGYAIAQFAARCPCCDVIAKRGQEQCHSCKIGFQWNNE